MSDKELLGVAMNLVDECASDSDDCHAQATCTETDLSFTSACNAGYAGDKTSCQADYVECLSMS